MVSINLVKKGPEKKTKANIYWHFVLYAFPVLVTFLHHIFCCCCWPLPCCHCYLPWIHLTDFKDAIYTRFTVCCLFLCHIQLSLNVNIFILVYTHRSPTADVSFVTYIQPRNCHTRTQTVNYMEIKICSSICHIEWMFFVIVSSIWRVCPRTATYDHMYNLYMRSHLVCRHMHTIWIVQLNYIIQNRFFLLFN